MSNFDWIVIALYFGVVFFLAYWVTKKEKQGDSSEDYFLAGKNIGWFVIGASLFASNIGSEHLVGLAGSGAKGDFAAAQFEVLASLILIILGWVFIPFYIKSGVFTMPEFLEKRYSSGARTYLSIISILAYIITKISVTIFAGALVFEVVLGIPFWTGAIVVVVATGVYTIFGGLRAVIYTDLLQMFVLVAGAIAVTYFGLQAIGGWSEVHVAIAAANDAETTANFFNLWRPMDDPDFPWTGVMFGAPILGIWYWCTDQFIVQRVLSAKDLSNARKGTIFGGFLKTLPLFLFVIPGVIAYALSVSSNPDLFTLTNSVTGETTTNSDSALPAMIATLLPTGIRGLVVAGLLAALMSSLSSVFNSCSTLFTIDFYKKYKPNAAESELVKVGRIATIVLVIVGLAWIPMMQAMMAEGGLFKYLQEIQGYIAPPIAAVFLFGLFFKRINARGAAASLATGFFLGMSRLSVIFYTKSYDVTLAEGFFSEYYIGSNFLHFSIFIFIICTIVLFGVSYTAPQQSDEQLKNVTYEASEEGVSVFQNPDFWLSVGLVVLVIIIWIVFSPLGIVG